MLGEEFRARLGAGELLLGCNVRHSRTSEIGAILRDCGFHWLMLDNEHSPMPSDKIYDIGLAAIRAGVAPLARARQNGPAEIGSHLTNGMLGVIVPHVNTALGAALAAKSCRFPPDGDLSVPGSIPQFGYGRDLAEAARLFNRNVLVVVMIESREALANLDSIAATPGIDVLFIGASDLIYDLGIPGDYANPLLSEAVRRVCSAARAAGKFAGLGGIKDDRDWVRFVGFGVQFVLTENDLTMLIRRARERAAFFNGIPRTAFAALGQSAEPVR